MGTRYVAEMWNALVVMRFKMRHSRCSAGHGGVMRASNGSSVMDLPGQPGPQLLGGFWNGVLLCSYLPGTCEGSPHASLPRGRSCSRTPDKHAAHAAALISQAWPCDCASGLGRLLCVGRRSVAEPPPGTIRLAAAQPAFGPPSPARNISREADRGRYGSVASHRCPNTLVHPTTYSEQRIEKDEKTPVQGLGERHCGKSSDLRSPFVQRHGPE